MGSSSSITRRMLSMRLLRFVARSATDHGTIRRMDRGKDSQAGEAFVKAYDKHGASVMIKNLKILQV